MTADELRSHGELLYGTRWKSNLAAELPISTRSIRYWLAGTHVIRPVIVKRIEAMVAERLRS